MRRRKITIPWCYFSKNSLVENETDLIEEAADNSSPVGTAFKHPYVQPLTLRIA
jgi:hypothetical protein